MNEREGQQMNEPLPTVEELDTLLTNATARCECNPDKPCTCNAYFKRRSAELEYPRIIRALKAVMEERDEFERQLLSMNP